MVKPSLNIEHTVLRDVGYLTIDRPSPLGERPRLVLQMTTRLRVQHTVEERGETIGGGE